jgi:hypothetical protein
MLGLLGSAALADLISIDFNHANHPVGYTESGLNTDVNGDTSLPGQVGAWNVLLIGQSGGADWQANLVNQYHIGSLKNGDGAVTSVSFDLNTNGSQHAVYIDNTPDALHRDWISGQPTNPLDMPWKLTGLDPSTVYRLRMFGRETGTAGSVVTATYSYFTATGSTTDNAYTFKNRNCADLWVKSTAGGEISGTLERLESDSTWSGIQIEWNVPQAPVVSIDFGFNPSTRYPGLTASGVEVDKNGDQSLPGQLGTWNELLMGNGLGDTWNLSTVSAHIDGLLDGAGNATTVSFFFNSRIDWYVAFTDNVLYPNMTALYRDCVYVTPGDGDSVAYWKIDGLAATTEYTLKLFGYQNWNGPNLFADFSATGLNTASDSTSASQNYVDLVVTSTVNGQITGMLTNQVGQAGSSFAGIQVQASGLGGLFPLASDLISIDFDSADAFVGTASGTITDINGDTSWAQEGLWNLLVSGTAEGGDNQWVSEQPIINDMFDGEGNSTTVDFHFNTGTPVGYYVYSRYGRVLLNSGCYLTSETVGGILPWKLTGLQPYTYYTLKMFGQQDANTPRNFAAFTASGIDADSGTNSFTKNYVDLTVISTSGGEITGTLVKNVSAGAFWSGMQILKLTDDPYELAGTLIIIQ